ncbi:MAG: adenylate kinase [Microcoleus sp. PH2017_10_PVI_O_A]|uniref:adenylate kinase n=1 Tax=unclassified Microcoleus TaxID=2642155 RepID=UPI001D405C22|nr:MULTISPECIES: adenylate kinase [unclassified Microcoleus]TAE84087.1 MAG: adenylate kinase [Oscillatoriales cyanobacterium]MCC3405592.1 adenylate kinase [Microcoleus sp. PH2017_10_PVI_O_A]MCC3459641.1 adenylate kinase [Microcoleus sp. PH2017_11_PCY_U_A]MCC3478057.1 adenylate kinase [Microcoleus sp. PH2017_12_PCY_D_A]MCC3528047.1 adenylate kinase [Microcoleus sp. PH2017_21_RUC_O_A]
MQLIFMGPPGAGKGTQAQLLAALWKIPHISTGDILRACVVAKTALGQKAKAYMDAGELVPDELLMDIVQERMNEPDARAGWILDGFPRTVAQAAFFDKLLCEVGTEGSQSGKDCAIRAVNLDVPDNVLVTRLLSRGRQDDNEETIRRRLQVYREQTEPLIEFYSAREQLVAVDGDRDMEVVTAELQQALSGDS